MTQTPDWPTWCREHKGCYEIAPLLESHGGQRVQTGFEVNLFAQLPTGTPAQRSAALPDLYSHLRQMLESMVQQEHPEARLEIDAFKHQAKLRPETEFAPEVQLSARIVRRHESFENVPDGTRDKLKGFEERLRALGLQAGTYRG